MPGYKHHIKSLLDRIAAFILLLLLLPLGLLLVLLLGIANNGHPFFLQQRPGLYGKIFCIIKFRTMNNKRDADGSLLPDA
ncbi:MAG TPA: sugar transferase, partial [Chitinophaga sp.]|uniref:sugar transferase n=1 Tax=Chitinophaga sp. TaxID=1869181 RepID=UPI002F9507B6